LPCRSIAPQQAAAAAGQTEQAAGSSAIAVGAVTPGDTPGLPLLLTDVRVILVAPKTPSNGERIRVWAIQSVGRTKPTRLTQPSGSPTAQQRTAHPTHHMPPTSPGLRDTASQTHPHSACYSSRRGSARLRKLRGPRPDGGGAALRPPRRRSL
jgi:hypothetical protein